MHRILALGLRIAKYCWQDLTHYSRCRYYPYQEGQKRSWSAVGGCRGMSRERSKRTIQVGKRQRSVQQHTTSLTVLFTSNSSGVAMFMLTASWQTDLVRFIWWCCLRWTSARNSGCELRVASWGSERPQPQPRPHQPCAGSFDLDGYIGGNTIRSVAWGLHYYPTCFRIFSVNPPQSRFATRIHRKYISSVPSVWHHSPRIVLREWESFSGFHHPR